MNNSLKAFRYILSGLLSFPLTLLLIFLLDSITRIGCPVNTVESSIVDSAGKTVSSTGTSIYPTCGFFDQIPSGYFLIPDIILFLLCIFYINKLIKKFIK